RELESLVGTLDPRLAGLSREIHPEIPDVHALIDRLRRAGQDVVYTEEGHRQAVDDALQISVYRIVQEALTNVGKHAAGADANVMIRYRRDAVDIEVGNVAATAPSRRAVAGAGQGLIG